MVGIVVVFFSVLADSPRYARWGYRLVLRRGDLGRGFRCLYVGGGRMGMCGESVERPVVGGPRTGK